MARIDGKREQGRPILGGDLNAVSVFEMCQFLMVVRRTGKLTVKSGKRTATLDIEDGQIVRVVDDLLQSGEDAFYRIACWSGGRFEFAPGPVTGTGIGVSTDGLLLEAARRLDEGEMMAETEDLSAANRVQSLLAGQYLMEDVAGLRPTAAGGSDIDFRKHFTLETLVQAVRHRGADSVLLGADRPARVRVDECLVDLGGGLVPRRVIEKLTREIWGEERAPQEGAVSERTVESGDVVRAVLTGTAGDVLQLDLLAAEPPLASEFGSAGEEFLMALGLAHAGLFVVGAANAGGRSAFFARLAYEFAESGRHVLWISETRRHAPRPDQGWIETADLLSLSPGHLRRRLLDGHVEVVLLDPVRDRSWGARAIRAAARGAAVVLGVHADDMDETVARALRLLQPQDADALDTLAACARGAVHLASSDAGDDGPALWSAKLGALTEGAVRAHFNGKTPRRKAA